MSVDSGGAEANHDSSYASVSANGRYVAFASHASNLVAGDTNSARDVFVRDRWLGTTERVSVDSAEAQSDGSGSGEASISADGRYVAFWSNAANLAPGDTGYRDVFVRDRQLGTTERVSVSSAGTQGNDDSGAYSGWVSPPSISADGRYVAYWSSASNLVAGDTNGTWDIFLRDRQLATTERVSVSSGGGEGNGDCYYVRLSADGRYVAFASYSTNLVGGDTNGGTDIFVRDRQLGTTERVSLNSSGVEGAGNHDSPSISDDGRYVGFYSGANNLVPGDTNGSYDAFLRDRQSGTTERVSVDSSGLQGNGVSGYPHGPLVSADGRYVVFDSDASNLVAGDTNGSRDIFVRDRQLGTTQRVSVDSSVAQANGSSAVPAISPDGRYVAFESTADNLVAGDANVRQDVFVRDLDATGFTSLCDPGVGGVIACPCSNPPAGSGQGCDNSAATGGAILSASGISYLSIDSLVFTTSGEKPTATSVLLQGTTSPAAGVVYGQGVRCVGGTMKRLFTKAAVGGSITAPNFGAGDPTVSARSAAKGSPISAGQSRWYLVFYRDPTVLGGCPVTSTFNASQTGKVDWSL